MKNRNDKMIELTPIDFFAERKGFEPLVPVRVQRFSRPPRSTTPASFLISLQIYNISPDFGKEYAKIRYLANACNASLVAFSNGSMEMGDPTPFFIQS